MNLYSIIGSEPCPDLSFSNFINVGWFGVNNLLAAKKCGQAELVRAVYKIDNECHSALWSVARAENKAELILMARDGMSSTNSTNRDNYHITAIGDEAAAYASALNVSGFYIRTTRMQATSFSRRFPEWDVSVEGHLLKATLEVL
tara:strand:- start:1559 stop:1993 length:435 start_codon:yes stop_codon:yes gene_type:complete